MSLPVPGGSTRQRSPRILSYSEGSLSGFHRIINMVAISARRAPNRKGAEGPKPPQVLPFGLMESSFWGTLALKCAQLAVWRLSAKRGNQGTSYLSCHCKHRFAGDLASKAT